MVLNSDKKASVSTTLSSVPRRPGVYLLKGAGENVLYVGKAKDLKGRLSSYFQKSASLDARKSSMMRKVGDFSFIATDNELEALALEANLIKQYKPKFNIVLRDDKNYPYLRLSMQEQWPRLDVVRRIKDDGAMYFGPYVPAGSMWEALSFIKKNFGLRPCRYRLEKPMRPCIEYEMGRCLAPCAGLVTRKDYMLAVEDVVLFLRGRRTELLDELQRRMKRLSDEMKYEEAREVRDRLSALKRALESQKVISPELGDIDVIGFHRGEKDAVFQVLFIRSGIMIGARDFYLKDVSGLSQSELYSSFIVSFYSKEVIPPGEIVLGTKPEGVRQLRAWLKKGAQHLVKGTRSTVKTKGGKVGKKGTVSLIVPKDGKRLELLRMADENAKLIYEVRKKGLGGMMEEMKGRLWLESPPVSIGAFDVSTLVGGEAVGAFVFWSDGEFQKDRYRRVRIKTVEGIDDYAMMKETVSRVLGDVEAPDMILIDGGRGHLSAVLEAMGEMSHKTGSVHPGSVTLAIAKKPDRLFSPLIDEPLDIGDRSPSSVLLRKIRDEAHRFAIGYHKKLRDKRLMASPLEGVPGIGKKRRLALLRRFKGLEGIKQATFEELACVPGMTRPAAEALKRAINEDR
jgi:excinuclease ABC subunit C